MGLFGSSTKTTVGTSVARVIADDQMPDAVLDGMTHYLIAEEGEDQMVAQVMESLVSSIGTRANRMYNYGKDSYTYGLPSGSVHSSFAGKTAAEVVLKTLTGGPVSIAYYHFGPLNNMHIGWKKLTEDFGYDYLTNEIVGKKLTINDKQIPVYLKDMQLVVTDATLEEASNGSLDQWGTAPNAGYTPENKFLTAGAGQAKAVTPFAVDPQATGDYLLVSTCWEVQEPATPGTTVLVPKLYYGSFTIPLTGLGYDFTADWHQAKYVDHNNKTGYWIYQVGHGQPTLDAVFDAAYDGSGHFFPWAYFRYNKTSMGQNVEDPGYLTTKKLLKTIQMDYDQLIESIHKNPDIKDVEQAMMVMAVPADSDKPIELRYLFDFFSGLYESVQDQPNAATNTNDYGIMGSLLARATGMNRSSMIIQDKRFKMALNWRNIVKRKVAGNIGPAGTYKGGANSVPSSVNVPSLGGGAVTWDTSSKRHWYQHQITEQVYEEIQIFDLKLTYYIFEQYTTTGDENNKDILLIPVDISIAKSYSIPERELLYSRALHYVFNSRVVTKLKWYQTGIFRTILVAVAIVITVLSYGSTWQTIGVALAAGTVTLSVVLMALIQELIKYLVISLALKLFVKAVGVKFAFIVVIVAAVTGSYQAIEAGSIEGAPWAKELLSVSTGLTKAIGTDLQADYQDLLGQQSEFEKYIKDQTKLLDETKELLNQHEWLAPLVIFGESSNDFFQRTVHSGNIGAIGSDAVASFVDVALTLPKLADTIS